MTKFCPECGTKQKSDNNHFCSNCGFDFSRLEEKINIPIESNDSDSIGSDSIGSVSNDSDSIGSGSVGSVSNDSGSIHSDSKESDSLNSRNISPNNSSIAAGPISSSKQDISSRTSSNNSAHSVGGINSKSNSSPSVGGINSKRNSNGILSNLSFNKCFLAFAVILIILFIIGIIGSINQEPYSDNGLTSFMEYSDDYNMNSFLEDTSSDDSDYTIDGLNSISIYDKNKFLFKK